VTPAVLVILGALSFDRTRDWRDEMTLWTAAVRVSPDSYQAHTNLGIEYYRLALRDSTEENPGDAALLRKALDEYAIAEAIFPTWFNVPFNQGLAYLALGRITKDEADFDAAEERFRRCLELSPGSFRARWHLAVVDSVRGRKMEALAAFEALRAEDDSTTTIYDYPIAKLQGQLGRWAEAERTYRRIVELERSRSGAASIVARLLLAEAIEEQGRLEDAEGRLRAIVAERPHDPAILIRLARFLRRTGRGEDGESRALFHRAVMAGYRPSEQEAEEILRGRAEEVSGTTEE
jgi:tetratricopeptide (TPR) repeat protein